MHSLLAILSALSMVYFVQPANILVFLPMPFFSHTNNFMPIFRTLASRGHNVTVVSPFPQKTPVPNLTDIVVPSLEKLLTASTMSDDVLDMDTLFFKLAGVWTLGIHAVPAALQLDEVQKLITDTDSRFDLILIETWFSQEAFVAFGHKFNAPVINLMSTFLFPQGAHYTGNYLPVTYVPTIHFAFNDHMTFHERLINSFLYMWDIVVGKLYYLPQQEAFMRKYFKYPGSENLPPLTDMLRRTSLTLVDQHLSIGYQVATLKNIVNFGGINIKRAENLPEDLQTYMDKAKDGFIYFSFGSFMTISNVKPFMQEAIISALGKVKQKVLLKADDPTVFKRFNTENIEIRKWFPQPSVLAHPNCKLFITHGGLHGLMEGVYNAVPMIGIPLMADQKHNAKFIETVGIGELVDIYTISETKLLNTINKVLNNPSYSENMKERSAIFKDNPTDIMDNVIYWIEYVIRHKGAQHLRSAVLDLHWYQYLMLDLIAFYLLTILLIFYIIVKLIRVLLKYFYLLFSRKNTKKTKKE